MASTDDSRRPRRRPRRSRGRMTESQLDASFTGKIDAAIARVPCLAEYRREGASATIVLMAKYPEPGQVKTRLTPALTTSRPPTCTARFSCTSSIGSPRGAESCAASTRPQLGAVEMHSSAPATSTCIAAIARRSRRPSRRRDVGRATASGTSRDPLPRRRQPRRADKISSIASPSCSTTHDVVIAPADDGGYWCRGAARQRRCAKIVRRHRMVQRPRVRADARTRRGSRL